MIRTGPRTLILARNELSFLIGIIAGIITLAGCAAKEAPLAIRLYNPNTRQTLHCTARDESGQHSELLTSAVESCARQLEANGFVREN